jgi:hypothetical protein
MHWIEWLDARLGARQRNAPRAAESL